MCDTGEVVLIQLFCRLTECKAIFYICRRCYRGQVYCSDTCRSTARRRQLKEARRRYNNTPEAKLDQRDRQREWRKKRRPKKTVMDQGSPTGQNAQPSKGRDCTNRRPARWAAVLVVLKSGLIRVFSVPRCVICGRAGVFVNPYHIRRSYRK